jgi:PAS domain S-box-containing protein
MEKKTHGFGSMSKSDSKSDRCPISYQSESPEQNQYYSTPDDDQSGFKYKNEKDGSLKQSEERYRSLFDKTTIGIYHSTPSGQILMANPAACHMMGYNTFEELAEINLENGKFMPSYSREQFRRTLENEGEIIGLESTWTKHDGSTLYVRENSRVVRDSEGTILYYEGTIEDISDKKIAEDKLRASEEKFRKLSRAVEQSPVSIVITDTDGSIEYANPKTFQTTGYTLEELMGQNPRVLKSGETNSSEYSELWQLISSGKEWRGLFHNRRKNGELYWESSNISPITDSDGKITHYVAVKEDVTEKKAIEKALIESEEKYRTLAENLREMNTTKDKLFSIIAHDMRGPIGSFIQVLDILTGEMKIDDNMRDDLLEELCNSSKNIFNLLENLLNWSKIQRSLITLHPKKFNLTDSLRENIDLLSPNSKQKGINISLNTDENVGVFADKDTINLIIRNLISNAIKFTPERGTIQISADNSGELCEVSIKDSGVGMIRDILENLFKPGSYYSSFGTNGERGSGIGLVLVKDFVERNGGVLRAESVPGEGSRFLFTLPKI